MSSSSLSINYALLVGIHSVAAAILFVVLYAPFAVLYLRLSIRNPTYVFIILTLFCVLRMTAFIMRAVLAESHSAAQNLHLMIAEQIIYSVGFFGILYAAYTLVLNRELAKGYEMNYLFTRITSNRTVFRFGLLAAVVLGIIGSIDQSSGTTQHTIDLGKNLRIASIAVFVAMTALLAFRTLLLAKAELAYYDPNGNREKRHFGDANAVYILCAIVVLLLTRQVFYAATIKNQAKQQDEKLFYPFAVSTEFIAATLFAIPGLVPPKSATQQQTHSSSEHSGLPLSRC